MVVLKVNNIFTDIEGDLSFSDYQDLEKLMSFFPEGYQFSPMYNKWILDDKGKKVRRIWDGRRRQIWRNKKRTYFPTGLYSIVREFFLSRKIKHSTLDYRIKPEKNINLTLNPEITIRDYQEKDVITPTVGQQRGIIQAATGSGKTLCAAVIIQRLAVSPFIFFVTSIDLLLQAKRELQNILRFNGEPLVVGQIGGGTVDIRQINVMTVQTAVRSVGEEWNNKTKFDDEDEDEDDKTPIEARREEILKLLKTAKGAMADEVHHWKAETCQLVARNLESAFYTFGLSATPWRDSGDDLMIQACFGKKTAEISASKLIRKKWLIKPQIKIVHIKNQKSQFRQWQQIYKEQVTENAEYNQMVANIANAYIQEGRTVLVLFHQIKHGKLLASLIPGSEFLSGSSSKKNREEKIQELRDKKISCICASTILDEGVDVRVLDTLILAGGGKSKTRALQRIGRILRPFPGKTTATAIDFRIHQKYLDKHSIAREKIYKTEPEFEIEHIHPDIGEMK